MTVLAAFLRRDWLIWSSYRLSFVWNITLVLGLIAMMVFVASAVGSGPVRLNGQARDYASFLLAGVALTDFFTTSLTALSHALREGQLSGTLEPTLLAPIRLSQLLPAASAFRLAQSLVRLLTYLIVGTLVLGYWQQANIVAALLVFLPACLVFALLGVLSASFVLVVKQGDPIITGYAVISGVLGGTLFPLSVLPAWLQALSNLLPLSHALTGIRLALQGAGPSTVRIQILVLATIALALLPAAAMTFSFALRYAKREGSLVQY